MKTGKKTGKTTAAGETSVTRSLKRSGRNAGADSGSQSTTPEEIEGAVAEASCSVGRTVQPAQFEALKVEVGVRLPCSVEDATSGEAHRRAFELCRRELRDQLERGTEGLE